MRTVEEQCNLGNLLQGGGDCAGTKRCYTQAIRQRPEYALAWNNLAGVLKNEGDVSSAIAAYREAVRLDGGFADAHCNLGNALKQLGRLDEAVGCYRQASAWSEAWVAGHPEHLSLCGRRSCSTRRTRTRTTAWATR
jgi:protein O-GlcNAc transferase